jgi:hypothetical protein
MRFKPVVQALWIAAVLLPTRATAQVRGRTASKTSASKIIEACIRAEGGPKRLAQQRAIEFQGTVTDAATKASGSFTMILERPNRLYREVTIGGESRSEAYNGKSAWRQDSNGLGTLTGDEGTILETEARFRNQRFVDYKKDKERVQLRGDETVRGRPAHAVEVITATNVRRQVYFDASSHLILEEVVPQGNDDSKPERISYDDYRSVDGIPEPFHMEYQKGAQDWMVTISRVSHNPSVDEGVFAFPAAANRPLPDIADLLKAVDANQKAIETLVGQYTCDKTEERFDLDSHGVVKSKGVREYNVFYLDGDEVDRLVKKDGRALDAAEEQKENDHIQKVVNEYEKKQARKAEQPHDRVEVKRKSDDVQISDFLRIDHFTNPRRETFRGHEVIVFDFEPDPSYKPASMVESFLHDLTGAVWIDEQARDVVRLEAYLAGNFKVGGGLLASLKKGSAFTFEQSKINEEVWLPSSLEAHVNARLLLLKGMEGNFIERYRNYKKFRVESMTKQGTVKEN